mmetsp:Transcript_17812/g.50993  ORF Transcript_17812/g.50993 Transcript_17812/m.50993 type:complete len:365 (-) Transcript_17812:299-1393(-)
MTLSDVVSSMTDGSGGTTGGASLGSLASTSAAALTALLLYRSYANSYPKTGPDRPRLVLDSIETNTPIYYFGVGSNLSRKKLENRSMCGKKIHILSMEPCVIPDHRLAFNMRALPPLEPAMGGLEPLPKPSSAAASTNGSNGHAASSSSSSSRKLQHRPSSRPLKSYEKEECHGALIQLSAEDYDRVYKSEGGGRGAMQGYEEIVVTCVPYDASHPPVQAVAYRAREHVRLEVDTAPSKRYMGIIREGAQELGLKPCYQRWLEDHPVQRPSWVLKKVAMHSVMVTLPLSFGLKVRIVQHVQSWLLFRVYVLPTEPRWKQIAGEAAACLILLPTACVGFCLGGLLDAMGLMPPMLQKWIDSMKDN